MRIILLLGIVCMLWGACSKQAVTGSKSYPDSLAGKWNYVEYYASSGGPGSWYPVTTPNQWIELKQNGVVNSNIDPFKDASGYELPDSNKIKFIIASKPNGFLLYQYSIDTLHAALVLSPLTPICIEGCALKFKR